MSVAPTGFTTANAYFKLPIFTHRNIKLLAQLQQIAASQSRAQISLKLEEEIGNARSRKGTVWPLLILSATLNTDLFRSDSEYNAHFDRTLQLINQLTHQTLQRYHSEERTLERCWGSYFETANPNSHSIQDLFTAINLLLNYELGIAAASLINEGGMEWTEADFHLFMTSIEEAFSDLYEQYFRHKPQVRIHQFFGGVSAQHFGHFSVRKAMQHAWVVTTRLATSHPVELPNKIQDLDCYVLALNRLIYQPGVLMGLVLRLT